jgi:hypothetical protein
MAAHLKQMQDSKGALLYSPKSGEWKRARILSTQDLLEFLNNWKLQSSNPPQTLLYSN